MSRVEVTKALNEQLHEIEIVDLRGRKSRVAFGFDSQGLISRLQVLAGKVDVKALIPMVFQQWTNIKTSSNENIFVDLLTQSAYTERRSTIKNAGSADGWFDAITGNLRGKFFPRGCRGFIEQFNFTCRDAGVAGGDITVFVAPEPGMGYVWTGTINVAAGGAGAAFRSVTVRRFWNYDSLFIWWLCDTDIEVAYSTDIPYDSYLSADAATWTFENSRYLVEAVYAGQTVSDVPISGTINNIQIPNIGSEQTASVANEASATWTSILTVYGAGSLLQAKLSFDDLTAPTAGGVQFGIRVYTDGTLVCTFYNWDLTQNGTATSGRNSCGEFFQVVKTFINLRFPAQFTRKLEIRAFQSTGGAVNVAGWISANLTF